MKIKTGVIIDGMKGPMLYACSVVEEIFIRYGYDLILTCGLDGKHMIGSKHYNGLAGDFRTSEIPTNILSKIVNTIRIALGNKYDLVLHATHLHIEFDPKGIT